MKLFLPSLSLLLFFLFLNTVPAQLSLPYVEGFEQVGPDTTFTTDQISINGLSGPGYSWSYFKPDGLEGRLQFGTYTGFANHGRRAATMDDFAPNSTYSKNQLILTVDLSNYAGRDINLNFSYLSHHEDSLHSDSVWIRGSLNDPWLPVYDLYGNRGVPNEGLDGVYKDVLLRISRLLQANGQQISNLTQIKFGQEDNSSAVDPLGADGITIDDVVVWAEEPIDVGISAVYAASSSCRLQVEPVTVLIQNYGQNSVSNIPFAVNINDTLIMRDTFPGPLLPGSFISYTLPTLVNMIQVGDYHFQGWTELASEVNRFNDSSAAWVSTQWETISNYPFLEEFKSGDPVSWRSYGSNNSWALTIQPPCGFPDTFGGFYTFRFQPELLNFSNGVCGAYGYSSAEKSYLQANYCFDFGLNPSPVVTLDLSSNIVPGEAGLILQSSIDEGQSWQTVGSYQSGKNWYSDSISFIPGRVGWSGDRKRFKAEHYLFDLAGEIMVQFRFVFASDSVVQNRGSYVRISDFNIYELPASDVKLVSIASPVKSCDLGSAEQVSVRFINRGYDTLRTMPFAYRLDNGPVMRDTLRGAAIPLDDTASFTFSPTLDVSIPGTYELTIWAEPGGYYLEAQDSLTKTIRSLELTSQFPFFKNFEDSASLWYSPDSISSWKLATPRMPHISGAPRGDLAWVTAKGNFPGTGGMYENEKSYLYVSNCFDFSALSDPVISFDINWYLIRDAYAQLQYSIDDGQSWQPIGSRLSGGENWYNGRVSFIDPVTGQFFSAEGWVGDNLLSNHSLDAPRWLTARHSLAALAGEPEVRFRYASQFQPGPNPFPGIKEGVAIDNFAIYESVPEDASMRNILMPKPVCDPTRPQALSVVILSHGTDSLFEVPLAAQLLPGGSILRDTFRGVLPPGQLDTFVFSAFTSTTLQNGYTFIAWTELVGDQLLFNDTIKKDIAQPGIISQFPYQEDFEQDEGGWYSYGALNSWARVIPDSSLNMQPRNGFFAWASHGVSTDFHTNGEGGYVESPCFDFTNIELPQISLDIDVSGVSFLLGTSSPFNRISGMKLQYTLDDGLSWHDLGKESPDWYNTDLITSFPDTGKTGWTSFAGLSPLFSGWLTVKSLAPELAGEAVVKLRVAFFNVNSGGSSSPVAFDNIDIREAPIDLSLGKELSPSGGCQGGTIPICVEITNNSGFDVVNPTLSYSLNGRSPVSEVLQDTIHPLDTVTFCFTRKPKIVAGSPTRIVVWTDHSQDTVNHNDTTFSYLPGSGNIISDFPYLENFDDLPWERDSAWLATQLPKPQNIRFLHDGWANDPTDQTNEWLVWSRRNNTNFPRDNAANGGHYLQASFDSLNAAKEMVLFSPCFDISGMQNPEMRVKISTAVLSSLHRWRGMDIMYLDLIHNGNLIPNFATMKYNAFNQKLGSETLQPGRLSGRYPVSGSGTNQILQPLAAIDDFEILDLFPDDIALKQIRTPFSGMCSGSGNEVWVVLENIGTNRQTGFSRHRRKQHRQHGDRTVFRYA